MNDRIVIDPKICHCKPVIRGTRPPVTVILRALASGDSFDSLQNAYSITSDDIRACIAFVSAEFGRIAYCPLKAQETAFAKVLENDEDAVYDSL